MRRRIRWQVKVLRRAVLDSVIHVNYLVLKLFEVCLILFDKLLIHGGFASHACV